jgi:hypothetical protein
MIRTLQSILAIALIFITGVFASRGQENATSADPKSGDKKQEKKDKATGTFKIGKETTYVTGPLDAAGRIDYAAAINDRLGKGVTPATNAVVLLWNAMGAHPDGVTMPAEFFHRLGIAPPPETGKYFVEIRPYIQDQLKREPPADILERHGRATSWPWSGDDEPLLASWLEANEKPLGLVVEATKRKHYYNPLIPEKSESVASGLLEARLPGPQKARALAAALSIRAMRYTHQGKLDEAWNDLLAGYRLGRLIGRGGTLIEGLVGVAINQIIASALPAYIERVGNDVKRLEACARDLRDLPPLPDVAEQVSFFDRFMLLDVIMNIDRRGLKCLRGDKEPEAGDIFAEFVLDGINWDPALQTINLWIDRLAAGLREKTRAARVREYDRFVKDLKALKERASDREATSKAVLESKETGKVWGQVIGNVLVSLMLPAAGKVQDAVDRSQQIQENLQVAFALARYRADHREYPTDLRELTPKYLARVPDDLFSTKPLIYRLDGKGYLLYSVGLNGQDDGGRSTGDDPKGDDLVIRMPPKEPRRP